MKHPIFVGVLCLAMAFAALLCWWLWPNAAAAPDAGAAPPRQGRTSSPDPAPLPHVEPSIDRAATPPVAADTLRGRLVGADGTPLAGLPVVRIVPALARGGQPPPPRATTDDDGRFSFERSAENPLRLRGVIGLPRRTGMVLREPARFDWPAGESVDLGDRIAVPAASVVGVVRRGSGPPIAGAEVAIRPVPPNHRRYRRTATTDEEGRFQVVGLEGGAHAVETSAPNHIADKRSIELTLGLEHAVDVTLRSGFGLAGVVRDEQGQPIGGVLLALAARAFGEIPLTTKPDGSFELTTPDQSPVTVTASCQGFATRTVELQPPDENVTITLEALASVTGTVTDEVGRPIEGAAVTASGDADMAAFWQNMLGAVTDASGAFEIRGLEPGTWTLEANHPRHLKAHSDAFVIAGRERHQGVRIRMAEGASVRIQVRKPDGSAPGFAQVKLLRQGVEASLDLRLGAGPGPRLGEDPRIVSSTLANGGSAVLGGLPSGRYRVSATVQGFATTELDLELDATAPQATHVLELDPGGHCVVHALDHQGQPLPGVNVVLRHAPAGDEAPWQEAARAATDASGTATLGPVAAGPYQVGLALPRHGPPTQRRLRDVASTVRRIRIAPGGRDAVRLVAPKPAILRGVVRHSGAAQADVDVQLLPLLGSPLDAHPILVAKTNDDGEYRFFAVDPGSYRVRTMGPDGAPRDQTVTIASVGSTVEHDIDG